MNDRPPIPSALKRKVLVEAGHRCAIPTCRQPTIELAHIEPYAKVKKHTFENLIALCPNCHTRFDRGQIDRLSMKAYKRKLVFLSDRYSHYELDVMETLRTTPRVVVLGELSVRRLLDENLIKVDRVLQDISFPNGYRAAVTMLVGLTDSGERFLDNWANPAGHELEY